MSQIEAATSYSGWRFLLKLDCLQPQEETCYHVVSSKTGSQDWLAMPSLPDICRREAWKEWAPFSWRSCKRSWHNFAAAKDQTPEPQLHQSFTDGSRVKVFWSPSGTFCPKARGLSPQRIWELPVCLLRGHACPAPQKLQIQCNIPSQKRTRSGRHNVLLKLTNWDVTKRSCHFVCCLAFLVETGLFATTRGKMLSRGIIQDWKSRLACDAIFAWHLQVGGHGKSEPRSVGVLANAHGITLLLQRTEHQNHNSTKSFADGSRVKVFWSPSGTFYPKARGLSPQRIWEQAPCVFAAWPCLSCPPKAANSMQHSKSETYKKLLI